MQFPGIRTAWAARLFPLLLLLKSPAVMQAQFTYTTNDGTITITGYAGPGGAVTIPSETNGLPVTSIGYFAFLDCLSLTDITIPDSITNIGYKAFSGCYGLTNVSIPNSVTSIGSSAFEYCSGLVSVTIGNSVTSIGSLGFYNCTNLTAITVDASNSLYRSVDGVLFNKSQTILIQWPEGKAGSYMIPSSVTRIGLSAFSHGTCLISVTIPNSVTNIEGEAFYRCTSLTAITVDGGNAIYRSVAGVLFNQSQTTLIQYPAGKAGSDYTVPDSVTTIGDYAFAFSASLTRVTMGTSVTYVGYGAFNSCNSLTGVYFRRNPPNLGWEEVSGFNNATVYYLPGTTGWGPTFGGRPTAQWRLPNPLILSSSLSFGAQTNGFGFVVSWATNASIVVEAGTDLANPTWSPLQTNALIGGSFYFSDPEWTNHPARFYRIRSP